MQVVKIRIDNFKAIKSGEFDLNERLTVLVGSNGSGKSSFLQALHWTLQSGRNPKVSANSSTPKPGRSLEASTLSARHSLYTPSLFPAVAGHDKPYGNTANQPQLTVRIDADFPQEVDGVASESATLWLKAARNEGVSVHIPTKNRITEAIRGSREISAYIPGLSGIPLSEEKKSKLAVHRLAAAGDSNTVLRNILLLLAERDRETGSNDLGIVRGLVSQVMGGFNIKVGFDEELDLTINAEFDVNDPAAGVPTLHPLELAGIGYLQILQIFAYIVYFKPRLLLVDEPDAHLYPAAQERLSLALYKAAEDFDAQIIMSTHSPSIVRSLPSMAKVIWMKGGAPQGVNDGAVRTSMGWGLLDKKVILMTEDRDTGMLNSILSQWPEVARFVAVWPMNGSGNQLDAQVLDGLTGILGSDFKIVLHRDADFLVDHERREVCDRYEPSGHTLWFTKHTDIEAYWCNASVIAAHYGCDTATAEDILNSAVAKMKNENSHLRVLNRNYREAVNKLDRKRDWPSVGESEIVTYYESQGNQYSILGKKLLKAIKDTAQSKNLKGIGQFGASVPRGVVIAQDLKCLLDDLIQPNTPSLRSN